MSKEKRELPNLDYTNLPKVNWIQKPVPNLTFKASKSLEADIQKRLRRIEERLTEIEAVLCQ